MCSLHHCSSHICARWPGTAPARLRRPVRIRGHLPKGWAEFRLPRRLMSALAYSHLLYWWYLVCMSITRCSLLFAGSRWILGGNTSRPTVQGWAILMCRPTCICWSPLLAGGRDSGRMHIVTCLEHTRILVSQSVSGATLVFNCQRNVLICCRVSAFAAMYSYMRIVFMVSNVMVITANVAWSSRSCMV